LIKLWFGYIVGRLNLRFKRRGEEMRFKNGVARAFACVLIAIVGLVLAACDPPQGGTGRAPCGTLAQQKAVIRTARAVGFSDSGSVKALQVVCAESQMKAHAKNGNGNGSVDYGWLQFNNRSFPKVIKSGCAYKLKCALAKAYEVTKRGANWSQWCTTGRSSCGGKGHDKISQFKRLAQAALRAVKAEDAAKALAAKKKAAAAKKR
jgi:hypothetical protein